MLGKTTGVGKGISEARRDFEAGWGGGTSGAGVVSSFIGDPRASSSGTGGGINTGAVNTGGGACTGPLVRGGLEGLGGAAGSAWDCPTGRGWGWLSGANTDGGGGGGGSTTFRIIRGCLSCGAGAGLVKLERGIGFEAAATAATAAVFAARGGMRLFTGDAGAGLIVSGLRLRFIELEVVEDDVPLLEELAGTTDRRELGSFPVPFTAVTVVLDGPARGMTLFTLNRR